MIRWDDSGSAIVIAQPELLAQNVLYRVYKQSRFASFSRQLNVSASTFALCLSLDLWLYAQGSFAYEAHADTEMTSQVGPKGDRGSSESDMSIWSKCFARSAAADRQLIPNCTGVRLAKMCWASSVECLLDCRNRSLQTQRWTTQRPHPPCQMA